LFSLRFAFFCAKMSGSLLCVIKKYVFSVEKITP